MNITDFYSNPMQKKRCPCCGQVIEKREIALFKGMYEALAIAREWCHKHQTYNFTMKDIRDQIGKNEYARFGDWVLFGGLVFKHGKASYGLNLERVDAFLYGNDKIPIAGWKDPITGEFTPNRWGSKVDIPGLQQFLDDNKLFCPRYTQAQLSL